MGGAVIFIWTHLQTQAQVLLRLQQRCFISKLKFHELETTTPQPQILNYTHTFVVIQHRIVCSGES